MALMIADPPTSGTRLGVGLDANRPRARNEAWKAAIGTKPVPARLALLPEGERRWDRIGVSAVAQILALTFFVAVPVFFPERLSALKYQVTPLQWVVTEVPVAPPPPPPPKVARIKAPEPKPIEEPKLTKQTVFEAKLTTPLNGPRRPKDEVKVNNLGRGSAAPATVNLPLNKVQTGGFGDPNGLPGKGNPNKTTNINRLGSPALPGGPGYGNGTGGDKGARG